MRSLARFSVMAAAVFVVNSTAQCIAQTTTTALFAEVVVGGGFSTTFTLLNTGSTVLAGNLILTLEKSDGTPVNVTVTDLALSQTYSRSGSPITVPISGIPSGGTMFLSAAPTNPGDSAAVGWGRVDSSGGTLGAVATFALTYADKLQTIAGVLSSDLVSVATIPVDDDFGQSRYTGYAVANPGSNPINIRVLEVAADGNMANAVTLNSITLSPGKQTASFFFQDPNAVDYKGISPTFRGSAVLIGQDGATFCVVALVQVRGTTAPLYTLYTAIPVIPSKAPNIN